MKIKKAVFPVAGFGTRFLPATKSMPKELLPIINKPVIHYAVDEAIKAGADTLIFITGRNKRAIEDYFDLNKELDSELRAKGKLDIAEEVKNIVPEHVDCVFIRQKEQLGLGHAVLCAKRVVGNEPFFVSLADDFLIEDDAKENTLERMSQKYSVQQDAQVATMEVLDDNISRYGVVERDKFDQRVIGMVEKPKPAEAPSTSAVIGRYLLPPDIFALLEQLEPGAGGEIQLTDALNILASKDRLDTVALEGERFDCGSVNGYTNAIMRICDRRKR